MYALAVRGLDSNSLYRDGNMLSAARIATELVLGFGKIRNQPYKYGYFNENLATNGLAISKILDGRWIAFEISDTCGILRRNVFSSETIRSVREINSCRRRFCE